MSGRLPLPLGQFCLGCGIGYVGNLPGYETDIWAQMQGNIQEDSGMFLIQMCVKGIQKRGASACLKHFFVNSQECRRMNSCDMVRKLRFAALQF